MKTSTKLSEKQIETLILNYLAICKGCLFYKNNNVGVFDKEKNIFRKSSNKFCPRGVSDIYGSYYGKAAYIEVKTPEEHIYLIKHYDEIRSYVGINKKKNHLKNQIHFIESNKRMGCIAFFASSLDQVKSELAQ
jgi:hypothetical protein